MSNRAFVFALVLGVLLAPPALGAQLDPSEAPKPVHKIPATASTREVADVTSELLTLISKRSEKPEMTGADIIWPVKDTINTPFGGDHDGIDIEGETGDPIVAAGSGRITFAGDDGDGYGTKIVIAHGDGISTLYSHLAEMHVTNGLVERGEVIGTVGCTGSCSGDHLHFEVQRNGRAIDPLTVLP